MKKIVDSDTLPAGVKSVTIHDPAPPYEADLGCHERKLNILTSGLAELIVRLYYGSFQSCLRDFNIGEPHDQATQPRMAWLNSNVPVRILGKQLTNDVLKSGPRVLEVKTLILLVIYLNLVIVTLIQIASNFISLDMLECLISRTPTE
ncbi:hypothetical protein Pst134EB_024813 [Puccinia striiformis f. sp. tritici]|nr:hypothetical protein Pst134EB_024813 [Puccinia striiformis f. sp. tritici]